MSKVYTLLSRLSLGRNAFTSRRHADLRPCTTRMLSITSRLHAKSKNPEDNEEDDKPIKFSTSPASHRTWNVDHSMGSKYQRPWWKVLPVSLLGIGFLLWCVFRKETELDKALEKNLEDHFAKLQSDEEEDDAENKPS